MKDSKGPGDLIKLQFLVVFMLILYLILIFIFGIACGWRLRRHWHMWYFVKIRDDPEIIGYCQYVRNKFNNGH